MKPEDGQAQGGRAEFLAELFHALNQPLTALRCALELALDERLPLPSRESLRHALGQAEQVAQLTAGIRSLVEAEDSLECFAVVDFEACVQQAVLELQPVAEAALVGVRVCSLGAADVRIHPQRLQQALFYLLEYAIRSLPRASTLELEIGHNRDQAVLSLTAVQSTAASGNAPVDCEESSSRRLACRLGLAISSRIFESSGGQVLQQEGGGGLRLQLTMPLAFAEPAPATSCKAVRS